MKKTNKNDTPHNFAKKKKKTNCVHTNFLKCLTNTTNKRQNQRDLLNNKLFYF